MFKDARASMGSWVYVFVEIFDALRLGVQSGTVKI